jgi:hypothetical protein
VSLIHPSLCMRACVSQKQAAPKRATKSSTSSNPLMVTARARAAKRAAAKKAASEAAAKAVEDRGVVCAVPVVGSCSCSKHYMLDIFASLIYLASPLSISMSFLFSIFVCPFTHLSGVGGDMSSEDRMARMMAAAKAKREAAAAEDRMFESSFAGSGTGGGTTQKAGEEKAKPSLTLGLLVSERERLCVCVYMYSMVCDSRVLHVISAKCRRVPPPPSKAPPPPCPSCPSRRGPGPSVST